MPAYVARSKKRGPSLLDAAFAILRKGEKAAKKESEPAPVKKAAGKTKAKKGAK